MTYSMTTTLARHSQPPDPTISHAIAPTLKAPHSAPTPLHNHHRAMSRLILGLSLSLCLSLRLSQSLSLKA